ncbi:MAG: hypothetical protein OXD50_00225 [Chloroflexi bacterium]|nr:hypothetical protein [Chloroflexota bacterium]
MDSTAALTEEQEQRRREGLRMLARIIARHYLEQPEQHLSEPEPAEPGERPGRQRASAESREPAAREDA